MSQLNIYDPDFGNKLATAISAAIATGGAGHVTLSAGSAAIGSTTDGGPAWTTARGVLGVPYTSADAHSAVASVTDAPTAGEKLVVDDLIISVDTTMSVTFKEETSGKVVHGPLYIAANSVVQITLRGKTKLSTADKKLQVITSVAGNISVEATYHSEA